MSVEKVGVRKFRAELPHYVSQTDTPIAITKHGDVLGYFIPSRNLPASDTDLAQLKIAFEALQTALLQANVNEDEVVTEFQAMRQSV